MSEIAKDFRYALMSVMLIKNMYFLETTRNYNIQQVSLHLVFIAEN